MDNAWPVARGLRYGVIGVGNVGAAIVDALLARGEPLVRGIDVAPPPMRLIEQRGFEFETCSIDDLGRLLDVLQDLDCVIMTASLIRFADRLDYQYLASHAVNVVGTENVISACIANNVQILVQTSSSHVVLTKNWKPSHDVDESADMVTEKSAVNHYGLTKAKAESLVREANSPQLLTACARLCSSVYGGHDKFITEPMMDASTATLFAIDIQHDWIDVESAALGHLLIEKGLHEQPSRVGGHAFNIVGHKMPRSEFYSGLAALFEEATGQMMPVRVIPKAVILPLAYGVELWHWVSRPVAPRSRLDTLTPATVALAFAEMTMSGKKAREVLGYVPLFSTEEAQRRCIALWQKSQGRDIE